MAVDDKIFTIPKELIKKVENGECIPFVGPGASLPETGYIGPPGPATLSAEIVLLISDFPPSDITLPWVAQLYEDQNGRGNLVDYVIQRMENHKYRPTLVHHWIATLEFPIIVSTAYDDLLDRLLKKQKRSVRFVLQANDRRPIKSEETQLIKLYGRIDKPDSLSITEEDLLTLPKDKTSILNHLLNHSETNSLLFVGYFPADTAFRNLFWKIRGQLEGSAPVSYIVWPDLKKTEVTYWQKRGLIHLAQKPEIFFAELREQLALLRDKSPLKPPEPDQPPELDNEAKQKLAEIVDKVLKRVGIGVMAESSSKRTSVVHNLDFARQLLGEQARASGLESKRSPDSPPLDSEVMENQAHILLQSGHAEWVDRNYIRAQEYFEDVLRITPDNIDAYISLHYLLAEMGETDLSLKMYRQALTIDSKKTLLPSDYDIMAVLGMGELGISYQVRDPESGALCSITVVRSVFTRDLELLGSFEEKFKLLDHRNIPRMYGLDSHRGRHFIAWEYAPGVPLVSKLAGRPLSMDQAFSFLDQVGAALEFAHSLDLMHLSLNSSNIIISEKGEVALVQFGIANLMKDLSSEPITSIKNTDYLSPEQRAGGSVDNCSDVFAFGTLTYEMITGRSPGIGAYEPPSHVNPNADEALDILIARARAIDPAQRFSSIAEMRREIQRIAQINRSGREYAITQPTRLVLRGISRSFEVLMSPPGIVALLILFTAALTLNFLGSAPDILRATGRGLTVWIVNIVPVGIVYYLLVRELARRTGLGSLIHVSRGIGVILATLISLWVIFNSNWGEQNTIGTTELHGIEFIPFMMTNLVLTFAVATGMLVIAWAFARLIQNRWGSFSGGFLVAYLLLYLLLGVLIIFGVSTGISPFLTPTPTSIP